MHAFFHPRIKIAATIVLLAECVLYAGDPRAGATFQDVTAEVGLTDTKQAATIAWVDYDMDGWVDLFDGNILWHNERGKKFTRAKQDLTGAGPSTWADFNNDGYLDFYTCTGKLYRGAEGGRFVDVSEKMPKCPMSQSLGAIWVDMNGDGFVDLYVGGYGGDGGGYQPDCIFLNEGGKSFKLVWQTKDKNRPARGITPSDFDNDGDVDIYVSNYRLEPNLLWQNDGTGHYTDVAVKYGVAGDGGLGAWGHTIASAWGDLDNDGYLDLFVGNFSHPPSYQDRPKFYKNLGPGGAFHFKDKSAGAGLAWQESFASPTLGDYDNDGDLDLYFTTVYEGDHSVLYRNEGNWKFKNVTAEEGLAGMPPTYEGGWADFDNDGDLDLITGAKLYRNQGNGNNWLKVKLYGAGKVNRAAIGAQVRIKTKYGILTRQVESGTGMNQVNYTLHFGLGSQKKPVEMIIVWPGGQEQKVTSPINRFVKVKMSPVPSVEKEQGNSGTKH